MPQARTNAGANFHRRRSPEIARTGRLSVPASVVLKRTNRGDPARAEPSDHRPSLNCGRDRRAGQVITTAEAGEAESGARHPRRGRRRRRRIGHSQVGLRKGGRPPSRVRVRRSDGRSGRRQTRILDSGRDLMRPARRNRSGESGAGTQ